MVLLSTLIREGIKYAPKQICEAFYGADGQSACALGAAICGFLKKRPYEINNDEEIYALSKKLVGRKKGRYGRKYVFWNYQVMTNYKYLARLDEDVPICDNLANAIAVMNDVFLMTREQIADYLEAQGL